MIMTTWRVTFSRLASLRGSIEATSRDDLCAKLRAVRSDFTFDEMTDQVDVFVGNRKVATYMPA